MKIETVTVAELRIAAKVLRCVYRKMEEDLESKPFLSRWWWRLMNESPEETLRKASLLDNAADTADDRQNNVP